MAKQINSEIGLLSVESFEDVKNSLPVDIFVKDCVSSPFDKSKAFCGFPRSSGGHFALHGSSFKGSYTDTTKYIPLYQSVLNLQQGKALGSGSSSVNLISDKDYDFAPGDSVPKDYKAHDGLLSMDIADVEQMRRDLQNQIDDVRKQIKNADDKSALVEARDALKRGEKIADSVIVSMSDKSLADLLRNYNNTIQ